MCQMSLSRVTYIYDISHFYITEQRWCGQKPNILTTEHVFNEIRKKTHTHSGFIWSHNEAKDLLNLCFLNKVNKITVGRSIIITAM